MPLRRSWIQNKMKKKILLLILILTLSLSSAVFVRAAGEESPPAGGGTAPASAGGGTAPQTIKGIQNPIKANNVKEALFFLVDIAIFIGTILAVLMFIWIGFKFVLAQGNDSKLKEAKEWFLYAAIGTAVLISAKVIVEVIKETFISAGVIERSLFEGPKK